MHPHICVLAKLHQKMHLIFQAHCYTAIDNQSLPETGDVLELIVPHCDPTINLFDKFFIVENNELVDVWDIDLRGKSQ